MNKFILSLSLLFLAHTLAAQVDSWSLGLDKGYAFVQGEVRSEAGLGMGLHINKHVTEAFQARLSLGMGGMSGQDLQTSTNWLNHPVWNGTRNPMIDYRNAFDDEIYANYQIMYQEAALQALFYPTQLAGINNRSSVDLFVLGGIGLMRFQTSIDAADAGDLPYDYFPVSFSKNETETFTNLGTVVDGKAETTNTAEAVYTPLYQGGLGLRWQAGANTYLSLSYRLSFTGTDELDSYQWNADNSLNGVTDKQHLVSIGITYRFSKKEVIHEPEPIISIAPIRKKEGEQIEVDLEKPELVFVKQEVVLTRAQEEIVTRAFENISFNTNEAVIQSESFPSLDELAILLAEQSTWDLQIDGHTDNLGEADFNLNLSKERAEAVRDYLIDKDIESDRFEVNWFGETQPIAPNRTSAGRQKNRRVELRIVE